MIDCAASGGTGWDGSRLLVTCNMSLRTMAPRLGGPPAGVGCGAAGGTWALAAMMRVSSSMWRGASKARLSVTLPRGSCPGETATLAAGTGLACAPAAAAAAAVEGVSANAALTGVVELLPEVLGAAEQPAIASIH